MPRLPRTDDGTYIGNGICAEFKEGNLILTTTKHGNRMNLTPEAVDALLRYIGRVVTKEQARDAL